MANALGKVLQDLQALNCHFLLNESLRIVLFSTYSTLFCRKYVGILTLWTARQADVWPTWTPNVAAISLKKSNFYEVMFLTVFNYNFYEINSLDTSCRSNVSGKEVPCGKQIGHSTWSLSYLWTWANASWANVMARSIESLSLYS